MYGDALEQLETHQRAARGTIVLPGDVIASVRFDLSTVDQDLRGSNLVEVKSYFAVTHFGLAAVALPRGVDLQDPAAQGGIRRESRVGDTDRSALILNAYPIIFIENTFATSDWLDFVD